MTYTVTQSNGLSASTESRGAAYESSQWCAERMADHFEDGTITIDGPGFHVTITVAQGIITEVVR